MEPAHHPVTHDPDEVHDSSVREYDNSRGTFMPHRLRNPVLLEETTGEGPPTDASGGKHQKESPKSSTPDQHPEHRQRRRYHKLSRPRKAKAVHLKRENIPESLIPRGQNEISDFYDQPLDSGSERTDQSEDAHDQPLDSGSESTDQSEDAHDASGPPTTDSPPASRLIIGLTRNNGIIYAASDYEWVLRDDRPPPDCHIFVNNAATFTSSSTTEQPSETACGYADLPSRVRISNHFLRVEIGVICEFGPAYSNHAAPFRTLVTLEKQFRNALNKWETEFENVSLNNPTHEAVLRTHYPLPDAASCFFSENIEWKADRIDHVTRVRLTRDGFRALVTLLDTDLAGLVSTARRVRLGRVDNDIPSLPFSHLWYLFPPGQAVVHSCDGMMQACFVLNAVGGRRSLTPRPSSVRPLLTVSTLLVDCFYLHFDGVCFRPVTRTFHFTPYKGTYRVTDLNVYPLVFAPKSLEDSLVERGVKLEGLVTPSHRMYHGYSAREGDYFDTAEEVDSDVIVDFRRAYEDAESRIRPPAFREGNREFSLEDLEETSDQTRRYDNPALLYAFQTKSTTHMDLLNNFLPGALTRDGQLVLPGKVYGYVLRSRKWLPLDINSINDVPKVKPGMSDGFQKLVLPDGHKDIIRALVNTHARRTTAMGDPPAQKAKREFDVVKGKGQGLIILLHGAPGVGKTSTAECVAANSGRPLLPITCGDLGGASVSDVERNLEKYFDLARKWECVLLLDEADVFLGAREKGDINQIMLASVFLRVLEYYSGILILTTNRVGSFDEAIKSRVHCALYYPPLDDEQSLKIWRMNLDMLEESQKLPESTLRVRFNRGEIEDFAVGHWRDTPQDGRWNGRQIKNAFQTAIALADWDHFQQTGGIQHPDGPLLTQTHFKTVATASSHFDDYLTKVRGTDQLRAKASEARRDDIRDRARAKTTAARRSKGKKKVREPSSESSDDSDDEDGATGGRRKAKSRAHKGRKKGKPPCDELSDESEEPSSAEDRGRKARKSRKSKSKKKSRAAANEPLDDSGEDAGGTGEGSSADWSGSESEEVEEKRPKKKRSSKRKSREE